MEHLDARQAMPTRNARIMRSIALPCAFLALMGTAWGQVATGYVFSQDPGGTWTPITGGTVQGTQTGTIGAAALDDVVYTLADGTVPFPFHYNNALHTGLRVSTNGFVTFGTTAPATTLYVPISDNTAYAGAISAFGRNIEGGFIFTATRTSGNNTLTGVSQTAGLAIGQTITGTGIPASTTITGIGVTTVTMSNNASAAGTTAITALSGEVRHQTLGSAPNRVFVVQWKGFKPQGTTAALVDGVTLSFQVRLYEADQSIEVVYGPTSNGTATTDAAPQVGLRGPNNTFASGNVNNRTVATSGAVTWAASGAGTANNSTCAFAAPNDRRPEEGLTYRWAHIPNVTVSGANSGNGSYTWLHTAIGALGTTDQAGQDVLVTINANIDAGATIGQGNWNSLTIRPNGKRSITATVNDGPLIDLNGADRVIIDGLNNGTDSLVISNPSTAATANTSTIRLINDAKNDTIRNCTVLGASQGALATLNGTILFGTSGGSTNTGNDNNSVRDCRIGSASTASKAVFSQGTATLAQQNDGNEVRDCEIHDFFLGTDSRGVQLNTGNHQWRVTGNKFYQTAARTSSATHHVIEVATNPNGSGGHAIHGNRIGGANAGGTGTYTVNTGGSTFRAISYDLPNATSPRSTIKHNTIAGISHTTSGAGTNSATPSAMIFISNGQVDVDTNTIGSHAIPNGEIAIGTGSNAHIHGIVNVAGTNLNTRGNRIENINIANTTANVVFHGLRSTATGTTWECRHNIVGGTASGSITTGSGTGAKTLKGILADAGTLTADTNTVRNLTANNTTATGGVQGIEVIGSTVLTARGNAIHDLSAVKTTGAATVTGISTSSSGTATVRRNTIYGLSASGTGTHTGTATAWGIRATAGTLVADTNAISDLAASVSGSGSNAASATAIDAAGNLTARYNTIATLSAASTNTATQVRGIRSSTTPVTVNRNTVSGLATHISSASNTGTDASAPTIGIVVDGGTGTVTLDSNTVHTLVNNSTDNAQRHAIGIRVNSTGATTVSRNAVYSVRPTSNTASTTSANASSATGIQVANGTNNTVENNMVRLGTMNDASPIITPNTFRGIHVLAGDVRATIVHNSVHIGGTGVATTFTPQATHALFSTSTATATNSRNHRNNILWNARGNDGAGGGKHFAVQTANSTTGYTSNSNILRATGTGAVLGNNGGGIVGSDRTDLNAWKSATTQDANSFEDNPQFANPALSVNPAFPRLIGLHIDPAIETRVEGMGDPTATTTLDFDGGTRATLTPVDIGADAGPFTAPANVTVSASNNADGNYATLAAALLAINGASQGSQDVLVEINVDLDAGAVIGQGNWNSLTIQPGGAPAGPRTISQAVTNNGVIHLNGADRVTIDGLNTGGYSLMIANTATGTTAGMSAIRFSGDASGNTVANCVLQGNSTAAAADPPANEGGVVVFSTGSGEGNDDNTITKCSIGPGSTTPTKAVYSVGSTGNLNAHNSGNRVHDCDILDFHIASGPSRGVQLGQGNHAWEIVGNRFYQTTARTTTAHYAIEVNATTDNPHSFRLDSNTVGHAAPDGTGTYTLNTGSAAFRAISFNANNVAGQRSTIKHNTIAGISHTSTGGTVNSASGSPSTMIFIANGRVDADTNTIGSQTGAGSITINTATNMHVHGIVNVAGNSLRTRGNLIGGIDINNANVGNAVTFYGLRSEPNTDWECMHNRVGGEQTPSIQAGAAVNGGTTAKTVIGIHATLGTLTADTNTVRNLAATTQHNLVSTIAGAVTVIGIRSAGTSLTARGNTIQNLGPHSQQTGTTGAVSGTAIATAIDNTSGALTAERNTIQGLSSHSAGGSSGPGTATATGINAVGNLVARYNTISSLGTTNTAAATRVRGILSSTAPVEARGNTVSSLSTNLGTITTAGGTDGATALIIGIAVEGGTGIVTLDSNTVHTLENLGTGDANRAATGIRTNGTGTTTVSRNAVYSLRPTSFSGTTANGSTGTGIQIAAGTSNTVENNMVRLGTMNDGSSITNPFAFRGIHAISAATIRHNSVHIGGENVLVSPGTPQPTYALLSASTGTRDHRNNILWNARSNNGSGAKHFAVQVANSGAGYTSNSNILRATGTGAVLGNNNNGTASPGDRTDLNAWKTATTQDANSFDDDPRFANPALSVNPAFPREIGLHIDPAIETRVEGMGDPTATTAPDFDGGTRAMLTPVDIGAHAGPFTAPANVTVSASNAADGNYATLAAALLAINGASQTSQDVLVTINADLDAGATIPQHDWNSLTILPNGKRSITATVNGAPVIDLNGADNVIIDGLNNGTDSLVISNPSTATSANTSTIRLINDAKNDTIRNCTVLGASQGILATLNGTILFGASGGTTNTGNDNNSVRDCMIGSASTASKAIVSTGTTTNLGTHNSGNEVRDCEIHDFFLGTDSRGVQLNAGNDQWRITGNKFYQTAARAPTATHYPIEVGGTGTNNPGGHAIEGNLIGGVAGGTTTYTLNTGASTFRAISYDLPNAGPRSTIKHNTIAGISHTTTAITATAVGSPSAMIWVNNGQVDVDTNTIGSHAIPNGEIAISTGANAHIHGIVNVAGTNLNTRGNRIENINIANTTANVVFHGLRSEPGTTWECTGNLVGGTVANSIQTGSGGGSHSLTGITASAGTLIATGNKVRNLSSRGTGTASQVQGIVATAAVTATGNGITALGAAGGTGANATAALVGINITAVANNVTLDSNTVHTLVHTDATGTARHAIGIRVNSTGGTGIVERNLVHSLVPSANASATTSSAEGIQVDGNNIAASKILRNNMVRMGIDAEGNSITSGYVLRGINVIGAGTRATIHHNSVYIGGTGVAESSTSLTHALRSETSDNNAASRRYHNNILFNARSNAGTPATIRHYAIEVANLNLGNLFSDHNLLRANGTGGMTGRQGATDRTLAAWQTVGPIKDLNSLSADPNFVNPTGNAATVDLHVQDPTPIEGTGTGTETTALDFDGQGRSDLVLTPTDIGADAGGFVPASNVTVAGAATGNGGYFTLAAAIAAIGTTGQAGQDIIVTVLADLEAGATIPHGDWNSLTIRPQGKRSIIATVDGAPVIDLNGADKVTIDGLNNGTDSLVISNPSTAATANTSTIRLINDAKNDTIRNCTVLGASQGALATLNGTILFGVSGGTTNTGNDNNSVHDCRIGSASTASKAVFSQGTPALAQQNDGNEIKDCEIHDFFLSTDSRGVQLNTGNHQWKVTGNKFYQTAARTSSATHHVIEVTTNPNGSGGHAIHGNRIGGANAGGTGTYTVNTGGSTFRAISYDLPNAGPRSTIKHNTIAGISHTTTAITATAVGSPSAMIWVNNGQVDADTNTIGNHAIPNGEIAISTGTNAHVHGIVNVAGTGLRTRGNTIENINIANTTASVVFHGLRSEPNTTWECTGNLVGGTVVNSIQTGSGGGSHSLAGITASAGTLIATGNKVRNLSSRGTGTASQVQGIVATAAVTATGNGITALGAAGGTGANAAAALAGINITAGTNNVTLDSNTVHTLVHTDATNTAHHAIGIRVNGTTGGTTIVERNLVHSLVPSANASATTSSAEGVQIEGNSNAASRAIRNNMVRIGIDAGGNGITNGYVFRGINVIGINTRATIHHNSVYIGGTGVAAASASLTHALRSETSDNNAASRRYHNNILFNARSNASTPANIRHYAIEVANSNLPNLFSDHNLLHANGTGGMMGRLGTTNRTLGEWQTMGPIKDLNSFSADPMFINPDGPASGPTPVDLHIDPVAPTPVEKAGTGDETTALDFDGQGRSDPALTPTDIGADAGSFTAVPNVTVSGANTGNGDYLRLANAIAGIGTTGQGASNILVTIKADLDAGATIPQGDWNSLTVRPQGKRSIIATVDGGPVIDLNGADRVTIDGLNNGTDSLVISNLSTVATAQTSTIRLINDAKNDTIRNCTVLGASQGALATLNGTILFGASGGATNTGNDDNSVRGCKVGSATTASKAIVSTGTTTNMGTHNSGNEVRDCQIHDFFLANGDNRGVQLAAGNHQWTISGNRFHQTAPRTYTGGNSQWVIEVGQGGSLTTAGGHTIAGNIIGFASASETGTYTLSGSTNTFRGIHFDMANGNPESTIKGNRFQKMSLSTTNSGGNATPAIAMIYVNSGNVVVGGDNEADGNTIGSQTGTDDITINAGNGAHVAGILINTATNPRTNWNRIGGITLGNPNLGMFLYGLRNWAGTGTWECGNNAVGGTVANSIQTGSGGGSHSLTGIAASTGTLIAADNKVRNLTSRGGGGSSQVTGITTSGTTSVTVTGNGVTDLTAMSGMNSIVSLLGIAVSNGSGGTTLGGNTVHSLVNGSTSGTRHAIGIQVAGSGTNTIERNLVHSLVPNGIGGDAIGSAQGIRFVSGGASSTVRNNMVRMGVAPNGTSVSNDYSFTGINVVGGSPSVLHNSVYIGGTVGSGDNPTHALLNTMTGTRDIRNNILWNARGGNNGRHYALRVADSGAGLTSDHNVLRATGTGGILAGDDTGDHADLRAWRMASGKDANSFDRDPHFLAPNGPATGAGAVDLHIDPSVPTVVEGWGADAGVADDIDGDPRANPQPDIGADEGNFTAIPACNAGPGPGIIAGDNTPPCPSESRTLGFTPDLSVIGVNWVWQVSTTSGSGFTDIPGSDNAPTVETGGAFGTRYFRVLNTCSFTLTQTPSAEFELMRLPGPLVIITPGDTTLCGGGPLELTASGSTEDYVWSASPYLGMVNGATTTATIPNVIATYVFTVTSTDAVCPGTAQATVHVAASPIYVAVAPPVPAAFCQGGSVNLTASRGVIAQGTLGSPGGTANHDAMPFHTESANPHRGIQYSFAPAQVSAAGIPNGAQLTSLSFEVTSLPVAATLTNLTVKLANNADNGQAAFIAATEVLNTPSFTLAPGTNTLVFGTSFTWTGGSLTVMLCYTRGAIATSPSVRLGTGGADPYHRTTSAAGSVCAGNTGNSLDASAVRPLMVLGYTQSPSTLPNLAWSPATGLNTTVGPNVTANPATTTTYTVTASHAGCTATSSVTVTVHEMPVVTSTGGPYGPYCSSDNTADPLGGSGTPADGEWSGAGVSGNAFTPAIAGTGTHTLTYTVAGTAPCPNATATVTVTVNPMPLVIGTGGPYGPYCSNNPPVVLGGSGTPSAGTWSGPGVTGGNTFSPAAAGAGTHTLTYTVAGTAPCLNATATVSVTVHPPLSATLVLGSFACGSTTNPDVVFTFTGTQPYNFTYTFNGGSPQTVGPYFANTFTIATAPAGLYQITALSDASGCTASLGSPVMGGPYAHKLFFVYDVGNDFEQVTWSLYQKGSNALVQTGGVFSNGNGSMPTCLPDGEFYLRVTDSGGDGIGGGYRLIVKDEPNPGDEWRIIDNTGNFLSGDTSAISIKGGVDLPLGDDQVIYTSCDKLWWRSGDHIVANENTTVSAAWVPNQPNSAQSANSGYEFWFYDPNGGYSFRKLRVHALGEGYANIGATRACHQKLDNWAAANHLPQNRLLNVRVRGVVNGLKVANWGPACRFGVNAALAACPPTKLMDIPGDAEYSCGVTRTLARGQRIVARPVRGATHYQWRFRITGEPLSPTVTATTTTYILNLSTVAGLTAGPTYDVEVRASMNGTTTWCGTGAQDPTVLGPPYWGDVCKLTIANPMIGQNEQADDSPSAGSGLLLWPNPNRGDQLWLSLGGISEDVLTVNVDVYDLSGKRVASRVVAVPFATSTSLGTAQGDSHLNTVIDLDGELAGGMYMVQVTAGDQAHTQRLVIQP